MESNISNQTIAGIPSQYYVVNGCKQIHAIEDNAKTISTT